MAEEIKIDSELALAEHIRELRAALTYCPQSGNLVWRLRDRKAFASSRAFHIHRSRYAGSVAGSICRTHGYVIINIFGVPRRAHRLAWMIVYGREPSGEIDHINGVRHDNRLSNLRDVCAQENRRNQKRSVLNKSGMTGVSRCKKTSLWRASITINGKSVNLGRFADMQTAVGVRRAAEVANGFHANHGRHHD